MYVQVTEEVFTSQGKTFKIYENEEEEKCFELYEILEDLLDYRDKRYVDSKLFPRLESMDMVFNFKNDTYITIEKLKDFLNGSCRKPLAKSILEDLKEIDNDFNSEPDEPTNNDEETKSKIPLAKRKAEKKTARKEKEEEREKN